MKFWFNIKSRELKTFSAGKTHADVMGIENMCKKESDDNINTCIDERINELQHLGWVRGYVNEGFELNISVSRNYENDIARILQMLPYDFLRVKRLVVDIDSVSDIAGIIYGTYEIPVFLEKDEDALNAWNNKDDAFRKYANIIRRISMKTKFSSRDVIASKELWVAAYERLVEKIMEKNDWSYEEAAEYIDNHSDLVDREYEDSFARAIDSAELRFKSSERKRRLNAAVKQRVIIATTDQWLMARKELTKQIMMQKGWDLLTVERYLDENPELVENKAYDMTFQEAAHKDRIES